MTKPAKDKMAPESTAARVALRRALHGEIDPAPHVIEDKRERLIELGIGVPDRLRFVAVDFEAGDDWWQRLLDSGFDPARPAVFASTGVSMYLTRDATAATMRRIATCTPGSRFVMSFLLPFDRLDASARSGVNRSAKGARTGGTPFISFYTPEEILALAGACGFAGVGHTLADELADRYFADRPDGLRPPSNAEELLVAVT